MPWPNSVSAGVSRVLASQYDDLLAGVQSWPAPVSAGGYALSDVGGVSLHTTNATWPEWQLRPVAGAGVASDAIVFQYNARGSFGAADAWADVWKVAQADGALTFGTAVTFLGPVTGLPLASNLKPGIISAADYANFSAAAASMSIWNNDIVSNRHTLFFNTANVSWQEFSLATNRGVAPAYDQFVLQYNTRTSGGGADFWAAAVTVATQSGNVAINTLLTLNGQLVLNAGMNINGQTITGDAHFLNTVFAASLNLAGGQETAVSGNPRFGGAAKFDGAVTFYNTVVSAGGLAVNSGLTLNSGVNCNGQTLSGLAVFGGPVTFNAAVTLANAVVSSGGLTVTNGLTLNSGVNANGQTFSGAAVFAGALQFYSSVSFSNAASISIGTNWTAWSPGISTGASYSGYSVIDASYYRLGKLIHFKLAFNLTFTGSTNYVAISLPFVSPYAAQVVASMIGPGGSNYAAGSCYIQGSGSSQIICYLSGWANFALTGYSFYLSGTYQVA